MPIADFQPQFQFVDTMELSRKVYIAVLVALFFYNIARSYWNVSKEPTYFEETELEHSVTFPSITVCPSLGIIQNVSFDDVLKEMKFIEETTYVHLYISSAKQHLILNMPSVPEQAFMTSYQGVFDFFTFADAKPYSMGSEEIIIKTCLTINVPKLEMVKEGFIQVHILKQVTNVVKIVFLIIAYSRH